MQRDAIRSGSRVVIVDDLLATGGTFKVCPPQRPQPTLPPSLCQIGPRRTDISSSFPSRTTKHHSPTTHDPSLSPRPARRRHRCPPTAAPLPAQAACDLVALAQSDVIEAMCIVELSALLGRRVVPAPVFALLTF